MNGSSPHSQYDRVWEQYREYALTSRKLKEKWERSQKIFFGMTIGGTILPQQERESFFPLQLLTIER